MPGYEVCSNRHFFLLFVKLNYIAALMSTQRWNGPDLVECALLCEKSGSDGITLRLHENRHDIQDGEVFAIKEAISGKLDLQIALSDELIGRALHIKPYKVTVVPQRTADVTTECGLDVEANLLKIRDAVKLFHDHHVLVSLSIEPEMEAIERSKETGADFIEIHTAKYCNAVDKTEIDKEIERIYRAANHAVKIGIKVSAGHGLNYENIMPVLYARALEEVHIGRAIVSRSLSVGLAKAVEEMLDILD